MPRGVYYFLGVVVVQTKTSLDQIVWDRDYLLWEQEEAAGGAGSNVAAIIGL
jgi:hypothetical protein